MKRDVENSIKQMHRGQMMRTGGQETLALQSTDVAAEQK